MLDTEDKLVQEVERYLAEFASQGLCDGDKVRDALLDIRALALDRIPKDQELN